MTDASAFPLEIFRADALVAQAHRTFALWSRASRQMAHGMMSAAMAQVELMRSMYGSGPADWEWTQLPVLSRENAQHNLNSAKTKYYTALKGYRRTNDELAASFFSAIGTVVDGIENVAPGADESTPSLPWTQTTESQQATQSVRKMA